MFRTYTPGCDSARCCQQAYLSLSADRDANNGRKDDAASGIF